MFVRKSCVSLALIILFAFPVKVYSAPVLTKIQATSYLLKFGYLSPGSVTNSGTVDEKNFRTAVEDFQRFAGLNVTGELDVDTIQKMSLSRCGEYDKVPFTNHNRSKRFHLLGSHWVTKNLTYNILRYPRDFVDSNVDIEIARAFALWSESTDFNFTLKRVGPVHINIKFAVGEHGDNKPFDGPGGAFAHAFSPRRGGEIHFDDSEMWDVSNVSGVNLFKVAAHELGHSLGLGHSNVVSALMNPFYYDHEQDVKLDPDDVRAIKILYGNNNSHMPLPPNFGPPNLPPDELCIDPKIDTIFRSNDGQIYAFKGDKYYKISKSALSDGYPKLISDGWPGLPGNIDAAFTYKTGKTYFFKGNEYWRYFGHKMDDNFPRSIHKDFVGLPSDLDAATTWNDNIYFYKGSQFWRFEILSKPKVKYGYPKSISLRKGLPYNLDAAIQLTEDISFYFKGDKYYQVDAANFIVTPAVPPFARPLLQWWFYCNNTSSTPGFGNNQSDDIGSIVTATN